MVYVNNKKFACESCIKGHRSSSCHHTDRPLFEIKKKGRPVSQCTKCRELRQSKKVHSKCTCDPSIDKARQEQLVPLSAGSKSKRYIPIVPALPNGLKDALKSSKAPASPADARQKVDTLLNPCSCGNLWTCKCASASTSTAPQSGNHVPTPPSLGLDALAHAASLQVFNDRTPFQPRIISQQPKVSRARAPSPALPARKRSKRDLPHAQESPRPSLAPIRLPTPALPSFSPNAFPEYEPMPPMSQIVSLAGSGCTCGVLCACPGCIEHRGPELASQDHRDCADGCGTCVDPSVRELGFGAPFVAGSSSIAATFVDGLIASGAASYLDQFYARAAALPPPPLNRRGGLFDLADSTDGYRSMDPNQAPVSLPKLDCCGGLCMCPSDGCSCGSSCGGACLDHRFNSSTRLNSDSPVQASRAVASAPRSCCAGKKAAAAAAAAVAA